VYLSAVEVLEPDVFGGAEMYRENTLKRRLRNGETCYGAFLGLASPAAAEIVAHAGFDCVLIDHEHGPGTLADGAALLRAVQTTPCTALIRVPWNDAVYVKRILDLGMEGVMFPAVSSAEEARAAVSACRYPPEGTRGCAASIVRASRFGMEKDYIRNADENLLVICQIETLQGVEAIPDIARVPGVDMLFVGPFDLSGSIGRLGQFDHPDVRDLLMQAERAILDSGCPYGTMPNPVRSVAALREAGCRLIVPGSDVMLLRDAALAMTAVLKG
jgi:4-hydroxy-2-oxoheptanedioate aldolase